MSQSSTAELTHALKAEAQGLGFQLAGVCPAVQPPGLDRLRQWLGSGYDGEMAYLRDRQDAYRSPGQVLDGARSILMLGMNYHTGEAILPPAGYGRVSRYAWGSMDYHDLVHDRLQKLVRWLQRRAEGCRARGVVDTAPLLEREFAQLAGLGWIGKNTMLINKRKGSWFFLAAVLTDLQLKYDQPQQTDHCGSCTACLDACPTGAFPEPGVLDARRCISYLTIEHRSMIDERLRGGIGDWVFGCDVCQDVCPWNQKAPSADEPAWRAQENLNPFALIDLFCLDDAQFRERFRLTPLWRARRRGLLRNAAIVLGNYPLESGVAALALAIRDGEPLVRQAGAWALGRYRCAASLQLLRRRELDETDSAVLEQIRQSIRTRCDHPFGAHRGASTS